MIFNKQSLFIFAVFLVISLLQIGRITAGDIVEDSALQSVMTKVGPVVGIIGLLGILFTFPLMFVAVFLEKVMFLNINIAFTILYLLLGVIIINSKIYKDTLSSHSNLSLVVYLTVSSLCQFVFDYMEKIRENKIAAGLIRLDAIDMLGTMIILSFSFTVSLIIASAISYLLKKRY